MLFRSYNLFPSHDMLGRCLDVIEDEEKRKELINREIEYFEDFLRPDNVRKLFYEVVGV